MVVPVELDPGRYDPRSPYYEPPVEERREQERADRRWEAEIQSRMEQRKPPYPVLEEAKAVADPDQSTEVDHE